MKTSKFIVLDLDNTMLFSKPVDYHQISEEDERSFHINLIMYKIIYKVTLRKHFKEFMDELFKCGYRVIVWSAGEDKYVKDITTVAFKNYNIEYTLTSNHLTDERKKLTTIKNYIPDFDVNNCLLIDDNPIHKENQYHNFVQVEPFKFSGFNVTEDDDKKDNKHLLTILNTIKRRFGDK